MRRTVFNEDHEAFRETLRDFIQAEVVPVYQDWYAAGIVPREFYYKLAGLGLFGIEVPEEYGGAGITSFKYNAIESEELSLAGVSFGGSGVHTALFSIHMVQHLLLGMVAPLLLALGAPVTLVLQGGPRGVQVGLLRILDHPVARALTHPVVAWSLFSLPWAMAQFWLDCFSCP